MRLGIIGILLVGLAVMGVEVSLHWYAGTRDTSTAHQLRKAYFYRSPTSGKAYGGLVDLVLPAIILGATLGTFGAAWPPRCVIFVVIILSLGIVVMFPWYWSFFQDRDVWLIPARSTSPLGYGDFVIAYIETLVVCGVFAYGAKLLAEHFQHPSVA